MVLNGPIDIEYKSTRSLTLLIPDGEKSLDSWK